MMFDWVGQKSLTNREKTGIDFETAKSLWLDERRVEIEMTFPECALIAKIQEKTWTAIYTVRDESVRLISVRRARTKEVRLYEEKTPGRSGG
jgi:uncharacterized protein